MKQTGSEECSINGFAWSSGLIRSEKGEFVKTEEGKVDWDKLNRKKKVASNTYRM